MSDPKGAVLRIASQAREAEIVRAAVEEHGPEVVRRVEAELWRRALCNELSRRPRSKPMAEYALDCLVALVAGQPWPPKEEK